MKKLSIVTALLLITAVFVSCANETPQQGTENETTTAPTAQELEFHLNKLPDIGEYVSNEKYEYFYKEEGALDNFRTSDDYGEIIPFYASMRSFSSKSNFPEDGEVYSHATNMVKFGFATTDGKIITDGIFNYVYRRENEAGEIRYICAKNSNNAAYRESGQIYIISSDGKLCKDLGTYIEWLNFDDTAKTFSFTTKSYDFITCDFDGNILYSEPNDSFEGDTSYTVYADKEITIEADDETCRTLDKNGKEISSFALSDGLYIERRTQNGIFIASDNGNSVLLDKDGTRIAEFVCNQLMEYAPNNCFIAFNKNNVSVYNSKGKLIKEYSIDPDPETFNPWTDYVTNGTKKPVICMIRDNKPVLISPKDGKEIKIDLSGYGDITKTVMDVDDETTIPCFISMTDKTTLIINIEGKVVAQVNGLVEIDEYGYLNCTISGDCLVMVTKDNIPVSVNLSSGAVLYGDPLPDKLNSISYYSENTVIVTMFVEEYVYRDILLDMRTLEVLPFTDNPGTTYGKYTISTYGGMSYIKDADGNTILRKRILNNG